MNNILYYILKYVVPLSLILGFINGVLLSYYKKQKEKSKINVVILDNSIPKFLIDEFIEKSGTNIYPYKITSNYKLNNEKIIYQSENGEKIKLKQVDFFLLNDKQISSLQKELFFQPINLNKINNHENISSDFKFLYNRLNEYALPIQWNLKKNIDDKPDKPDKPDKSDDKLKLNIRYILISKYNSNLKITYEFIEFLLSSRAAIYQARSTNIPSTNVLLENSKIKNNLKPSSIRNYDLRSLIIE